jgi:hypothetical protein
MTFTGTVVDINTALNGMSFGPTASFSGAASLQIVTNDQGNTGAGGPLSASDTVNITVAAVNDAPVNTVPGPQNTNEDTALVFSSGNGNQISIGDVDAGASPVQVTLTATNGTITLAGTSGLAFSTGDGTSDGTMTFTGTVVDINAALDGLSFTTPVGVTGSATLTVVTDDQGSTGGPAMSDTDVVNIAVSGLNDVPTIGVPGPQSSDSQTLVFSAARGTAITLDDLDANGAVLELTLTATNGAITLGNTSGITFMQGDGTDDPTMRIRGTVADLNQALDGLQFRASDTAAQLSVSLNDLGNTGAGGPAVASRQIDISQTPLSPPSSPPADSGSGSGSGSDSSDSGNDSDKNETPAAAIVPLLPPRPRSADSSSLLQPLVVRDSGSKDAAKLVMSIDVSPSRTAHVSGDELGNPDSHVVMLADGNLEKPVGLLGSASYLDAIEEQKLWDEIRALNDSIESAMVSPWTYGAVAGMGVLSAGYLLWAFQAGSLVTTALSSLPVWGSFDPLPVLEFWERDKHKNRDDHDEEDRYLHSEPETRLTS